MYSMENLYPNFKVHFTKVYTKYRFLYLTSQQAVYHEVHFMTTKTIYNFGTLTFSLKK